MDFIKYKEKMTRLNRNYDKLALIVQSYNRKMYSDIQKNKKTMQEETFQLVVVGEFSRGKSTFVNALLGRKILPAKLKPTTAVLTKIVYRNKPSYKLHYLNKSTKEKFISEEEFLKLVAPKEVDKNNQSLLKKFFSQQQKLDDIEFVEVGYPLDLCKDNVEIVDTPGTNDLSNIRLDITYNYLNKADAVIMLLCANQALTASELNFLKERILGNQIKDIFFVISYKDQLKTPNDQKLVLDFVRENLLQVEGMPKNLRIHLVSSMQALAYRRHAAGEELKPRKQINLPANLADTGFLELETELGEFLAGEKGNAKLKKYAARGQNMARQMYDDLAMQLDLVSHSADELNEKIARMKPEFEKAKSDVERYTQQMKTNLQNGISELTNVCKIADNDIRKAANNVINNSSDDDKDIIADIEDAVRIKKKTLIEDLGKIQNKLIKKEVERIDEKMRKIWQDLKLDMGAGTIHSSVMNINNNEMKLQISMPADDNPEQAVGVGLLAASVIGIITGATLGPILILGGLGAWLLGSFESDRKEKLRKQVSSHYSKEMENISKNVKENFGKQIDDICSKVQSNVNLRLEAMEEQLQKALSQKKMQESEVRAERERLLKHQQQLEEIYKDLTAIVQ